jgi:hypothetical protein
MGGKKEKMGWGQAEGEKGRDSPGNSLHSREKGKGEVPRLLLLLATLVEGSILPEIHVNQ